MERYDFLLDFFPLVEEISEENAVLGSTLQMCALELLLERYRGREKVAVLLRLAADLGYTSDDVVRFLLDGL